LKAYYYEAISAQPGVNSLTPEDADRWFWGETVAGKVLRAVSKACAQSEDALMKRTAIGQIVPLKFQLRDAVGQTEEKKA